MKVIKTGLDSKGIVISNTELAVIRDSLNHTIEYTTGYWSDDKVAIMEKLLSQIQAMPRVVHPQNRHVITNFDKKI